MAHQHKNRWLFIF